MLRDASLDSCILNPVDPHTPLNVQCIIIHTGWSQDPDQRPTAIDVFNELSGLKGEAEVLSSHPDDARNTTTTAGTHLLLSHKEVGQAIIRHQRSKKKFSAFISHHKADCATLARLLKTELQLSLESSVFLGKLIFEAFDSATDPWHIGSSHCAELIEHPTRVLRALRFG